MVQFPIGDPSRIVWHKMPVSGLNDVAVAVFANLTTQIAASLRQRAGRENRANALE